MGTSEFDPAGKASSLERGAEGRSEARAEAAAGLGIRFFLDQHRRTRDRALFDLAIDSKLRAATW